jgi:hypothetical protein
VTKAEIEKLLTDAVGAQKAQTILEALKTRDEEILNEHTKIVTELHLKAQELETKLKTELGKAEVSWGNFRRHVYKFFGGLFMEVKEGGEYVVSLTRTMTVTIFCHCLWMWHHILTTTAYLGNNTVSELANSALRLVNDVPPGEVNTLLALITVSGVKVLGTQVGNVWNGSQLPQQQFQPVPPNVQAIKGMF